MKRCLPPLLAALLALGAAGCQPIPEERRAVLGDASSVATPQPPPSATSDNRIAPKELTEDERHLVDLVASHDSVSLYHYTADPEWTRVKVWVESYVEGERQPDMVLGTVGLSSMSKTPDEPTEGDCMVKVINPSSGDAKPYEIRVVFSHGGAQYSLTSNPIAMKGVNGHGAQMLTAPQEIAEGQEYILRVDSYNPDTIYAPLDGDDLIPRLVEEMAYVFAVKCRFSKAD